MTAETNQISTKIYSRLDYHLTIFEQAGQLSLLLASPGFERRFYQLPLTRAELPSAFADPPASAFAEPLRTFFEQESSQTAIQFQGDNLSLTRLLLHINIPEFVTLAWEDFFSRIFAPTFVPLIIRSGSTPPFNKTFAFSPPLRILRYSFERTLSAPNLEDIIGEEIFNGMSDSTRRKVIDYKQSADPTLRNLQGFAQSSFEFFHLSGFRSAPTFAEAGLQFGVSRGNRVDMTAADLQAWAERVKMRLLILQVNDQDEATWQGCLRLGQTLLDAIGLSVLITNLPAETDISQFFHTFYDILVHDGPLDFAWWRAQEDFEAWGRTAFFINAPSEESLRFSNLIRSAQLFRQKLIEQLKNIPAKYKGLTNIPPAFLDNLQRLVEIPLDELNSDNEGIGPDDPQSLIEQQITYLRLTLEEGLKTLGLGLDWGRESTSSVPLVQSVEQLEQLGTRIDSLEQEVARLSRITNAVPEVAHLRGDKDGPWTAKLESISTESQLVTEPAPPDRYLNTWLENSSNNIRLTPKQRLWPEQKYWLHVNIGVKDIQSVVVNPEIIPPEYLAPADRAGGDWLHIAVYSLDFQLDDSDIEPGAPTVENQEVRQFARAIKSVWLPAYGSSEPIYFGVTPTRSGLVFLRICVYYRNQLLQSLRLEAHVLNQTTATLLDLPEMTRARATRFAKAEITSLATLAQTDWTKLIELSGVEPATAILWLQITQAVLQTNQDVLLQIPGLAPETATLLRAADVPDLASLARTPESRLLQITSANYQTVSYWRKAAAFLTKSGYTVRTEYTISPKLQSAGRTPRAATLFTNRVHDKIAIGVKGGSPDVAAISGSGWTEASAPNPLLVSQIIEAARAALDKISTLRVSGQTIYRFAQQNDPQGRYLVNQGKPETLKSDLIELAKIGYGLTSLLPPAADKRLRQELAEPGKRLHIARVAEDEVLPWPLYYDYELNPLADLDVCLTDIDPQQPGLPKPRNCGGGAGSCPRWQPDGETVCPWGFWGFRHIIEQPAQLVREGEIPRELIHEIPATKNPQLLLNVNASLAKLETHLQNLVKLPVIPNQLVYAGDTVSRTLPHLVQTPATEPPRRQILEALKANDPQLIYFYCHAGETDKIIQGVPMPYLSFGTDSKNFVWEKDVERYARSPWSYHPLIFLNGCESAASSPKTLGNFIQTFAELGAAGAIGTEIEVWEDLATKVAEQFLADFLAGQKSVGEILRDIRLGLLKIYNPLGLIYTAYCSADLRLLRPD